MRKGSSWIVLLALVALLTTASAAAPAIARPDPVSNMVGVGETFVVNLYIQDVVNMYAADIHLRFDPTVLQVQDAEPGVPGVQIQPLDTFMVPGFVIKRKACNVVDPNDPDCATAGFVWFAATQLNPTPPATGSGPVAAITFKALKAGVSPLTISYQKFSDPTGGEIASAPQNGSVTVTGSGGLLKLYLPFVRR